MSSAAKPRWILLLASLIPPAFIICWGELSELNVNVWFLPTINVSQAFLSLEQVLIGAFYLLTPFLLLLFFHGLTPFKTNDKKYLVLIFASVISFAFLRYLEFLYDQSGPSIADPFGLFYPLAFWSFPLLLTASAAFFLSGE